MSAPEGAAKAGSTAPTGVFCEQRAANDQGVASVDASPASDQVLELTDQDLAFTPFAPTRRRLQLATQAALRKFLWLKPKSRTGQAILLGGAAAAGVVSGWMTEGGTLSLPSTAWGTSEPIGIVMAPCENLSHPAIAAGREANLNNDMLLEPVELDNYAKAHAGGLVVYGRTYIKMAGDAAAQEFAARGFISTGLAELRWRMQMRIRGETSIPASCAEPPAPTHSRGSSPRVEAPVAPLDPSPMPVPPGGVIEL